MKKILFIPILLISFLASAQNAYIFQIFPTCNVYARVADTPAIGAQVIASDIVTLISYKQLSGPNVATIGNISTNWLTGIYATGMARIWGIQPGTYTFQATGMTAKGETKSVTDSLFVSPPLPPRTIVSFTFKISNGVWIPSFLYSDGSTQ